MRTLLATARRRARRPIWNFLFSGEAQHLIAQHGYRPMDPEVLKKHSSILPPIELFPITAIAKDWEDAQQKFFADNGVFDVIYAPKAR